MQWKRLDLVERYPPDLVALVVARVRTHRVVRPPDDVGVAPAAVVGTDGRSHDLDVPCVDADLLLGLAQSGRDDVLVTVPGTAGHAPRAALMGPRGAQLQEDVHDVTATAQQDQAGGAVEAPVAVAAPAAHPPVAVGPRHHVRLAGTSAGPPADHSRRPDSAGRVASARGHQ